jgi:hypothetical protein
MSSQRVSGAPEGIRTPDPQIRSLVLYPAELPAPRVPVAQSGAHAKPPAAESPGGSHAAAGAAQSPAADTIPPLICARMGRPSPEPAALIDGLRGVR